MKKLFLVLLIFYSCSNTEKKSNNLKINIKDNITSLDPRKVRSLQSFSFMKMIFDGLTRISKNGIELSVAKSLKISEDKKTYSFILKDSKWSNGEKLTSYDFLHSIKTSLNPNFPSPNAFYLYVIKNGKKIKNGLEKIENLGVFTPDEKTIIFELENPFPYFLELLSLPIFSPVNKKLNEKNNWADNASLFVGNGPFLIKKIKMNNKINLCKNKNYWDEKNVKIKNITLYILDEKIEFDLFEKKVLDWAGSPFSSLPIDFYKKLMMKKIFHTEKCFATFFLRANIDFFEKNFKNEKKDFLQNISNSIDRNSISNSLFYNYYSPTNSLIIQNSFSISKDIKKISFQKPISIMYTNTSKNKLIAQAIQRNIEDKLNIKILLAPMEKKIYFDNLRKQKYELAICNWYADFEDNINFLEVFKYKNNGTNNTGFENEKYIELLNKANLCINEEKRKELLKKAHKILIENGAVIPIFHPNICFLKNEKLKDFVLTKTGIIDFKWAFFEK